MNDWGKRMPGEGRRDLSGERSLLPSPGPPPLILQRLSTLSNPSPQLSLKQFGGRTELEKRHFLFYGFGKTFSLLLVSHRETNAKGQPYKPPATPLTLTKIFEEDGVVFGPKEVLAFRKPWNGGRCVYIDSDAYWFPDRPGQLTILSKGGAE